MNRISNLRAISIIASAMSDLNNKVAYIGGASVCLYSNDPVAEDLSESDNSDTRIEIACLAGLEEIRESLTKRGFTESSATKVNCQFHYEGLVVDIMSTEDEGWAQGNPWFTKGFVYLEQRRIGELKIIIPPVAYFLATKFFEFHKGGGKDPSASHDFEDITYVLSNRTNLVEDIINYPEEVKQYLKEEFKFIIKGKFMKEAILKFLPYPVQAKLSKIIMARLKKVVTAIQETYFK